MYADWLHIPIKPLKGSTPSLWRWAYDIREGLYAVM